MKLKSQVKHRKWKRKKKIKLIQERQGCKVVCRVQGEKSVGSCNCRPKVLKPGSIGGPT